MVVNDNIHMLVSDSGAFDTKIFNTGAAAIAFTQNVSGVLAQQIGASSAGVSTVNGLSGALSVVGSGNLKIEAVGQNIIIYDSGLANSGDLSTVYTRLTQSGIDLANRDLAISGALQALITNADADVSSVNGQSGVLQITGVGLITVSSGSPGVINVSVDTSTLATNANLALTGSQAWNAANDNGINLSGNLTQTGVQARVYSNFLASGLSGTLTQTGVQLGSTIAQTGSNLYNLTVGLSGTLTGYVQISTERIFATELPTGVESYFINWTPDFPSKPRVVQPTPEISTGVTTYFLAAQGITVSGYTVLVSDIVTETGVFVHTFAKL